MKSCPTCNRTFTDPNLSFCLDDGTPLVSVGAPADETTVVPPSAGDRPSVPPPTEVYTPRDWQASDYQPPGFQAATPTPTGRKSWPWVVGILAVLAIGVIGIGIAGAILLPSMLRTASNNNNSNTNVERSGEPINLNSNASASKPEDSPTPEDDDAITEDEATLDDATSPPSDKDVVLAALTGLEHEWTVANINADKEKLDRILADDYVGQSADGGIQGKAEYIRTIERDTSIQKWEFEDLKVTLTGDRATLDGVLRLQLSDREVAFKFTDKFVWREGRWQAVGSQVSRME